MQKAETPLERLQRKQSFDSFGDLGSLDIFLLSEQMLSVEEWSLFQLDAKVSVKVVT